MVSSIAIAAAEGFEPEEKPRVIDEIAADSQPQSGPAKLPSKYSRPLSRQRASGSPHAPRGPPDDDLEERIGSKNFYSINELAKLSDRSPATIFRLLRLGLLPCVRVGGCRCFTRAVVLDFLRNGTPNKARRVA
jgi:hypothetical protein